MPAEFTRTAKVVFQHLFERIGVTDPRGQPKYSDDVQLVATTHDLSPLLVPLFPPSLAVESGNTVAPVGRFQAMRILTPGNRWIKVLSVEGFDPAGTGNIGQHLISVVSDLVADPMANITTLSPTLWGETPSTSIAQRGDLPSPQLTSPGFTLRPETKYDTLPIVVPPGSAFQIAAKANNQPNTVLAVWQELYASE